MPTNFTYQYGVIPAGGTISVKVAARPLPITATLNSTAAGRAIAISTNNLATPAIPVTPDLTSTGMINYVIFGTLTDVVFTGNAGDAWAV